MKKTLAALLMTMFAALMTDSAFGQGGNGTLTGTVEDSAQALIPGVSITATNNATGVQTTRVSNESGAYNISSLLPGAYRLTATLPGFQTQTFNNIDLGTNETKRFNFRLQGSDRGNQRRSKHRCRCAAYNAGSERG
jgi:type 1 fimbria pilin